MQSLNTDGTSETPDAVIRLGTVVVDENSAVAKITEECTSEFSHFRRGLQPTGRLCVECSKCLEFPILFFRQEFDSNGGSHVDGAVRRFMLFS